MYNGEKLNVQQFIADAVAEIKAQVGGDVVVLGLSGGVDSTVTALLVDKAIGKNLVCIFVDHGLLRKNEFEDVLKHYEGMGLNVIGVRAADRFFAACKGITDPELKRKAIGKTFIDVFADEARKVQDAKWLDLAGHRRVEVGQGCDQEPPQRGRPSGGPAFRPRGAPEVSL